MVFLLRALHPDEADAYRVIRLEALRSHPEAFGADFAEEAARPLAFFAERLTGSTVFGGFDAKGALTGVAGFRADTGPKQAHKAMLWGVYVRPEARGSGLARRLVEAVIDHARAHAEILRLIVARENMSARRLYESLGFTVYGVEPRALRVNGAAIDEVLMAKYPL